MEIFGVGIPELILILAIAIVVLGPDGMVKTARSLGVFLRKVIKSPIWAQLMDTQRELRDMPTRLVREAGLEEDLKELKKTSQDISNYNIRSTAAAASARLMAEINGEPESASPTIAPPRTSVPAPESPPHAPAEPGPQDPPDPDDWTI